MKSSIRIALGALLALGLGLAIACGGSDGASPSAVDVAGEQEEAVADDQAVADADDEGAAPEEVVSDHQAMEDSHEPEVYVDEDGTLEYHVKIENFKFEPGEIEVQKGQTVRIVLDNHDPVLHDYAVEEPDFVVLDSQGTAHHEHEEAMAEDADEGEELVSLSPLHVAAEASQHSILVFQANEAGTYEFFCSVPGHRLAGMEGTLRVVE